MIPTAINASRYCHLLSSVAIAILDTRCDYCIRDQRIAAVNTVLNSSASAGHLGRIAQVAPPDCCCC